MEAPELNDYREHLLDALDDQPRRAAAERPGLLQVFVNHERVGTLDCTQVDPSFSFSSRERSIQHLEIRGESGVLIGGCVAPEAGHKDLRISVGKGTATIQVHNHFDGGSLQVRYETAPRWWSHVAAAIGMPSESSKPAASVTPIWTMMTAFAQIVLAVGVVALLAERVPSWMGSDDLPISLKKN